jgi:hypothetical protein
MTNVKELIKFLSTFDEETPIAMAIETETKLSMKHVITTQATVTDKRTGQSYEILIFLADNTNFENN